jgi:hypothetical protein
MEQMIQVVVDKDELDKEVSPTKENPAEPLLSLVD